jgi:ParB family chromosome partitioning protein
MNELYELRRLHGQHAEAVENWVAGQSGSITRDRISALRAELADEAVGEPSDSGTQGDGAVTRQQASGSQHEQAGHPSGTRPLHPVRDASPSQRSPHSDQRIHVEFDGQDYQLVVSVAPDQPGHLYVRPLIGGPRRLAPASALKLLGFVGS